MQNDNNFEDYKSLRRNNFKKNTYKKKSRNYEEDIDFTKKEKNAFKDRLRNII
jgi:hypothetical protein